MYQHSLQSSRHHRSQLDDSPSEHYNVVGGVAPPRTTSFLPLRRYGRARDISAALTAPVVEYQQPQWTMLHPPSHAMRQLFSSLHPVISLPSTEASSRREYDVVSRQARGQRAVGVAATAAGRQLPGSSPPPRPTTSAQPPHRSRDIAEVRPGCTTPTERVRYRVRVTRKLIDLYDEVSELYHCRENMSHQLTQAMRTDPRHCKEQHGEVQLAPKPAAHQQLALEAVGDALCVLHDAVRELVAAYLTSEEKRHLGIDTHVFQTKRQKANTYQYVPQPQQPPGGAARGAGGKTFPAAAAPSASLQHSEVCEDQERGANSATEDGARHRPVAPALSVKMPSTLESLSHQEEEEEEEEGEEGEQTPHYGARPSDTRDSAGNPSVPALSGDLNAAGVPLSVSPITSSRQAVVELSPVMTSPPSATAPLPSRNTASAATEFDAVSGVVTHQQPVEASQNKDAERAQETPERVSVAAASASTRDSTSPTGTAAGSPVHPQTGPQPPSATRRLVKMPVRGPDGQILITKIPPTMPTETKWMKVPVGTPAVISTNLKPPPSLQPTSSAPPSRLPSRNSSFANRAPAAGVAEASAPPPPPPPRTLRAEFKRFLVDSDSDSDMAT
ncbi:hypothetical protein JKF63_07791 [Porcisia hertigi]|uniref:Uncharacterized protein n=1 Tax=Porcisia hertigi TaxID=2761500 RepID=A0A836LML0_9TRYP|nr:hypothetical protein JKF63_07791 [Porcisia hertigi]